ncbi:ABC transporter permease [Paenibacillus sp. S150]|uniref:ABC transporter permease n=1 Tax=Paenibacillus sp. S150 TaxID=2749826 RepID=UPI001C596AA0|nr:ABC transporter permease [Paenibacillus sp. S150]MBW4081617.1 ABC transporter permease [Paenibacillus sp. S150]
MNIWTIMSYELRRLFRSRSLLINLFLLPLVLIFLLGTSLSGVVGVKSAAKIEPVRVAVVSPSGGEAGPSAMIAAFLESPEVQEVIIPHEAESRGAAESGLRTGKYGYAIIVPWDFDSKVQNGEKAQLEFILGKDHTDNMVAGTAFDNFLSTINYKQAAAAALGPQALAVTASSSADHEAVKLGDLSNGGRTYTASQFYAASMLLMFLLYSGITVTSSLFSEKDNHTLHRINSMPVKGSELFTGKVLGIGLVSIVQCLAIILLSDWLFGVYWGNRPGLLLLFCLLMIIASMMLSIVICLFSKTAASASSVISVITVCMTFLSGGMAPLPDSLVNTIGAATINHWAQQAIIRMMLHAELPQLLPNLLVLSVICLVMLSAAMFSYRKVGYHE